LHPHTFYSTLFSAEKRDEVFVIMSFASEFDGRWTNIIEPVIREDLKLTPHRVDYNHSGESIIHDILDGIAHARLVLVDITSSPMRDRTGTLWPQRNGNVMWELGIAHVMRMPDEIILIRSDSDPSIFDLTQFRAFCYDANNIVSSRTFVSDLAKDRLRTIDQSKSEYVRRCALSLDQMSLSVVFKTCAENKLDPPTTNGIGEIIGNMSVTPSIGRLLDLGALKTSFLRLTPEKLTKESIKAIDSGAGLFQYEATILGRAIFRFVMENLNVFSPEVMPILKKMAQPEK